MENLLLSVFIILSFIYVGLISFMIIGWSRLKRFRQEERAVRTTVSVIIAARNEEDKLDHTIRDILAQNYPRELFELIIVDDHSTDGTAGIVMKYAPEGVKLIRLQESEKLNSYKKKAISEAIKDSQAELIVSTDADCRMGRQWLRTVVEFYEESGLKLISSPVTYFEEKNGFEEMQTLEFLFLIGLGASAMGNRQAATCNGANLAYSRQAFLDLKGFEGIDQLASGDDELFLHKLADAHPDGFGFCLSREAIVRTHAKPDLGSFIQQRKRWASKSARYKNKPLVALGLSVWVFNAAILASALAGFFNPIYWDLLLIALVPKVIIELLFLVPVCNFAERKALLWYQPLVSLLHIVYLVFIGVAGNTGKYEWKGRSVR